jgi:membrane-bound lytic murein transglycosylase A
MPRRPLNRQRCARLSAGHSFHLKKMGASEAWRFNQSLMQNPNRKLLGKNSAMECAMSINLYESSFYLVSSKRVLYIIWIMTYKCCHNLAGIFLIFSFLFFSGCGPAIKTEITSPENALIQIKGSYPEFKDDMDKDSFALAVKRNLEYLNKLDPDYTFSYGSRKVTCREVREGQEAFLKLLLSASDPKALNREIRKNFLIFRATGGSENARVLFTGYYEPVFEAATEKDETFKYPLYKTPSDLIKVDLSLFNKKYKGESIIARLVDNKVLPYYSRKQIEDEKTLSGKGLEIAWLKDSVDVAFLQIQGSGQLKLTNGKTISVGYMGANGHPYNSIGRYMIEKGMLTKDEMSMQAIRKYLSIHSEVVNDVLNYNPSYVFFRVLDGPPLGNIQAPLTPGRSLALDSGLFPKGSLCFITCKKPVVNGNGEITGWIGFSRFIMNQDTGGAIKGAGRADIFWGSGEYAEVAAGYMKQEGELYMLLKKD